MGTGCNVERHAKQEERRERLICLYSHMMSTETNLGFTDRIALSVGGRVCERRRVGESCDGSRKALDASASLCYHYVI